jgi:hypothetical protein
MSYQVVLSTFLPSGSELSIDLIVTAETFPAMAARAISFEYILFIDLIIINIVIAMGQSYFISFIKEF